jgi:hypothetical protein
MPSNLTSISFPSSPSLYQTYTYGTQTYQWNGTEWVVAYDSNAHPSQVVLTSGNQTIAGEKTFSNNMAINSDLIVDTNTLFVNSSTNRVGIGTISPGYTLGVSGTLGVTGATTLSSTLGVTGATTLSSTLNVTGATTLSSLNVTGSFSADSNTLKIDSVNNRVGINKTPTVALDVEGNVLNTNPCFYVKTIPAAAPANSIIKFTTEDLDTASAYSPTTGLFTAPVSGHYLINATVFGYVNGSSNNGAYFYWYFNKNGSNIGIAHHSSNTGSSNYLNYQTISGSMIVSLAATDTIGVFFGPASDPYPGAYSSFSGYLIG